MAVSITDRANLTIHELFYNHIKKFETESLVSLFLDRARSFMDWFGYERKYLDHSTGEFSRTEIFYTKSGKKNSRHD